MIFITLTGVTLEALWLTLYVSSGFVLIDVTGKPQALDISIHTELHQSPFKTFNFTSKLMLFQLFFPQKQDSLNDFIYLHSSRGFVYVILKLTLFCCLLICSQTPYKQTDKKWSNRYRGLCKFVNFDSLHFLAHFITLPTFCWLFCDGKVNIIISTTTVSRWLEKGCEVLLIGEVQKMLQINLI